MFRRHNQGFTLIELLVVIAIIGILSSVVLASLNSAREKSRDAKRVSDIKQLQLALELYFDSNSNYPTGLATLETDDFVPQVPTDPVPGASDVYAYVYAYDPSSSPTDYHLGANLEQSDHSALDADSDDDTTAGGSNYTDGFNGADAGSCGDQTDTTRYCYDITN